MSRSLHILISLFAVPALAFALVAAAPDDLEKQRKEAIKKGVEFLKAKQQNGHWEDGIGLAMGPNQGGVTALATLALLEAGESPDSPTLKAALDYLTKQEPKSTYATALQTLAFCRADSKKFASEIERNALWLQKTARRSENKLLGWGYPIAGGAPMNSDNDMSNTHFAVEALYAASMAGAKVDPKLWREVHAMAAAGQMPSGGWSYHLFQKGIVGGERATMTAGAISCLAAARERCGADAKLDGAPLERGLQRLGERVSLEPKAAAPTYVFYQLAVVKKAAQFAGKRTLLQDGKEIDWRREGAAFLVRSQQPKGHWSGPSIDGVDVIATSFALRFLAD